MNFVRLGAHDLADDIGQRLRGRDRRFLARGDDGAGDAAGVTLLAEDIDDVGEIGLGRFSDHVRRGRAVMAHPHVERAAEPERKAALGLVELHRGNADVHHDAVDRRNPLRGADLDEIGEAVLDQCQPAVRPVDEIEAAGNRGPVAVDADHAGSRRCQGSRGYSRRRRRSHRHRFRRRGERASRPPRGRARDMTRRSRLMRRPLAYSEPDAKTGRQRAHCASNLCALPGFSGQKGRAGRDCPSPPSPQTLISERNLLGCHGISSVKEGLGRPQIRFGSSPLSNGT